MVRLLALNALFFLIPFAAYAGYLFVTRRTLGTANDWTARAVTIMSSIGAVAVVVGLAVLVSFEGADTDSTYIPAEIGEDGQIIPGRFDE